MERLWKRLRGTAKAELQAPEPERVLENCRKKGLRLWNIRPLDSCTLQISLWQRDLEELRQTADSLGGALRAVELKGGSRDREVLRRRKVLLLALGMILALLLLSTLFVWQVEVRGCEGLSSGRVLRALADCGVEPGCFWPGISVDLVRSRVLTEIPELEWMTVDISGSRALVLVREREERPEILTREGSAEIRASRPGIVQSVTVLSGRGMVQPGDAVLEGELLIGAELESLTRPARSVRALGEIRAETWYELSSVCPVEMLRTRERGPARSAFSLQFGGNRMNFWPTSGKGLDECDKIVHEYNLGIKGLFSTPLTLLRTERHSLLPAAAEKDRTEEMKAALLRRLKEQIDGEVLDYSFTAAQSKGLLIVTLRARCSENIAKTVEYYP